VRARTAWLAGAAGAAVAAYRKLRPAAAPAPEDDPRAEELRRKLVGAGLRDVWIKPYGQDAELLPLPRRIRLPITERVPRSVKDPILRRFGHQLGVRATKP